MSVELRYEYKYFVPMDKIDLLRKMIRPYTVLDKFADSQPDKHYTVRSIYFETPDFECYWTKLAHNKHRNKVRLRGYNLEDGKNLVFMEIKRKYEAPILKNRAPLLFEDFKKVLRNEKKLEDFLTNDGKMKNALDNSKRFFYNVYARKMKPVVTVIYEREPFLSAYNNPDNNLRITFDKNLRGCPYPTIDDLFSEKHVQYTLRGHFILEVKFNQFCPAWMKAIIGTLGLHKESASKYCMCIDAHNMIKTNNRFDTLSHGRMFREYYD